MAQHQRSIKISASILAADFGHLAAAVADAEQAGVDRIHVDVMDGHFVPNISIGTPVVASLRHVTKLPLETHLMIEEPVRYLELFKQAGSDSVLVHAEREANLHRAIEAARKLGLGVGVVINPGTPVEAVSAILSGVDQVLVMTVDPGFGGQALIPETISKVAALREKIDSSDLDCELSVDGGITGETAPEAIAAGADVLVAGSAIFRSPLGIGPAVAGLWGSGSHQSEQQ
ncbi:MAG: ribulose-phosphate 3-epimerase [Planctomycetota bacterium]|nr:ribulose-phosphate 3-epimerase [Planctomycetota bacterium]